MRLSAALRDALESLPPGFETVRGRGGLLVVRAAYREALLEAGFGPDSREPLAASELAGRTLLSEIRVGDERLLVRPYEHGGILRWSNRSRFADPTRPLTELRLAAELEAAGIETPLGVGARLRRALGAGWRLELVTRRVEGAIDVERAMLGLLAGSESVPADGDTEGPRRRLDRLTAAVGEFVGRQHALGFVHTDLTPRNVLVEEAWLRAGAGDSDAPLWLLDLDRCRFEKPLSDRLRRGTLARLLRYLIRRDQGPVRVVERVRVARFLRGYVRGLDPSRSGGDGASAPTRSWRQEWRAVEELQLRSARLHRAGWILEEWFGARPERGRKAAPRRIPGSP